jgi:putative restriction endonuclease
MASSVDAAAGEGMSLIGAEADRLVRLAAFQRLEDLQLRHGELISWAHLRAGFEHHGETIRFIGPQGIFKPSQLDLPLSIATAPEAPGKARPYDDELGPDGFLRYRYRGTDPTHRDNVGLRTCWRDGVPLVYFHGVAPGWYKALWPVFIHDDDPLTLTFTVAVDDPQVLDPDLPATIVDDVRRAYTTRLAVQRLHQAAFRHRVLTAYRTTCAICRLRHGELLDAAHIVRDSLGGLPVVPNGLALCKIHHAAFDANIVGVRPDLLVEIRHDVLAEIDGPMLRHGLQEAHGSRLVVPHRSRDKPSREFLELRYVEFLQAS